MPTIIKTADGKEHQFKCPECGGDTIETVTVDVIQYADAKLITMYPWQIEEGEKSYDSGNHHLFQCKDCAYRLTEPEEEDLTPWVEEHLMPDSKTNKV